MTDVKLSDDAETVLAALCEGGEGESISATIWAEAIVELLRAGFARLQGPLSSASLVATEAGERYARENLIGTGDDPGESGGKRG